MLKAIINTTEDDLQAQGIALYIGPGDIVNLASEINENSRFVFVVNEKLYKTPIEKRSILYEGQKVLISIYPKNSAIKRAFWGCKATIAQIIDSFF